MKRGWVFVCFAVVAISLFVISSSATIKYSGEDIERTYSGGGIIKGTIALELNSEPADAIVSTNFEGTISLLDLIKESGFEEGTDYRCTKKGCFPGYKIKSEISKESSIALGTEKIVGFNVFGQNLEIVSLGFEAESDIPASCTKQATMDILNNREVFLQNTKPSGTPCGAENRGCFDPTLSSYDYAVIVSEPYCEKIKLSAAPAYIVGAIVKNGTVSSELKMELFDSEWAALGNCILPELTKSIDKLGCIINHTSFTEQEFYACISTDDESSDYEIKTEKSGQICGDAGSDYDILGQAMGFDALGTFNVSASGVEELNPGVYLVDYVNNYLFERYENNCSLGCAIPFNLSGINQNIIFKNVKIKYKEIDSPIVYSKDNLYEFEDDKALLTTEGSLELDLEKAGFKIPVVSNETNLKIYLGGQAVLPNPINLSITNGFDFEITPKIALVGVETEFKIIGPNVSSVSWDFGDGTTEVSNSKAIVHRYLSEDANAFEATVTVTRYDGVESPAKTFTIGLGGMNESLKALIKDSKSRIENVTNQIATFPSGLAVALMSTFNITEANALLEMANQNITSDEERYLLISKIAELNIPNKIFIKEEGKALPFSYNPDNMDTQYIEEISGTKIASEDARNKLKQAIARWAEENYQSRMDYEIVSKSNYLGVRDILTYLKVDTRKREGAGGESAYLIMDYPKEALTFMGSYSEKSILSGTYIPLEGLDSVEIAISGEVNIEDIGIYTSPAINDLASFKAYEQIQKTPFNWTRFSIFTLLILFVAFCVYIALQEWYKRHYESYLFKNPADLYNIVNFIFNSRKSGLKDEEIEKKLKSVKWSSEQVAYAFKKLDGKRVGMFEIPIFRFFEKKKTQKEIEKRQSQGLLKQTKSIK